MHIEKEADTIHACRFCFMCRHVGNTSAVTQLESDTSRGRNLILFRLLREMEPCNADYIDTMYRSALSGISHKWCVGKYRPDQALLLARRDIVDQGIEPDAVKAIKKRIEETGSPYSNAARQQRQVNAGSDTILFVGADTEHLEPTMIDAVTTLCERTGTTYSFLAPEVNSGQSLSILGYETEAQKQCAELLKALRDQKAKRVICLSPSDYTMLKQAGDDMEILSLPAFLSRLLSDGKLTGLKKSSQKVCYVDSDLLGRKHQQYDEPRQLLAAVAGDQLTELSWTKDTALSCGESGGIYPLLYPDIAAGMARRIWQEASSFGINRIVCSSAVTKSLLQQEAGEDQSVDELSEYILENMD